jgi:hypothetical protein
LPTGYQNVWPNLLFGQSFLSEGVESVLQVNVDVHGGLLARIVFTFSRDLNKRPFPAENGNLFTVVEEDWLANGEFFAENLSLPVD